MKKGENAENIVHPSRNESNIKSNRSANHNEKYDSFLFVQE